MRYTYHKLRNRIRELYGTRRSFAKDAGISDQSVSQKLSGKRGFSQSDVERWAAVLGIGRGEYGEYFYT